MINNIFTDDEIINIVEKIVDDLPYDDFNYNGYNDLNQYDIGITNEQYLKVLMLKNKISYFEVVEDNNGTWMIVYYCNHNKQEKKFKVFYDEEFDVYRVDDNTKKDLNKILYYNHINIHCKG